MHSKCAGETTVRLWKSRSIWHCAYEVGCSARTQPGGPWKHRKRAKIAVVMQNPSLAFEAAAAQGIADKLLGVFYDFAPILLKDGGADFIKASYALVDGTKDILITLEISPVVFDLQVRAALRARGFDLPSGNSVHVRS